MSDTISCPQCSFPLQPGAVFCTSCGHRLEASAPPEDAAAAETPPEDATRVDTPGLHDATQAFTPPAAAPPAADPQQPDGGQGGAPGAPWQPADAGSPGPAAWTPPPQGQQAPPAAPPWQQSQPGAPQPGGAPQVWGAPPQGTPAPWDTSGTVPSSGTSTAGSPIGGIAALVGGLLTVVGLFTAWFELTINGSDSTVTGWALASGDELLESQDPYILLALGVAAAVIGVLLFMGQMRPMVRIAAVIVGVAIIGVTVNDWLTTVDVFEKQFTKSDDLKQAFGFYLTIAGGIAVAAAAIAPAKK